MRLQVCYLIVSIPDFCRFSYFILFNLKFLQNYCILQHPVYQRLYLQCHNKTSDRNLGLIHRDPQVMRTSRNFCQGGGPGKSDINSADVFFLSRSQMVKFKQNYHFSKVKKGSNIFQGGGGGGSNFFQWGGLIAYSP